jgi:hypothetical protein
MAVTELQLMVFSVAFGLLVLLSVWVGYRIGGGK